MKTKKQKNNLKNLNGVLNFATVLYVFFAVVLLILLLSIVKINYEMRKICGDNYYTSTKGVEINTDKNVYLNTEKINLIIKNNEEQSIYFKPCEYLNNFEKKVDGEWKKERVIVKDTYYYDQVSFNKNKSVTKCEIELPEAGEGTYRSVIEIYYNCLKPGYCESSKTFYSNEFEVNMKDSFCEDKILENCDGKKVSIIGTFVTSKAQFLTEIEDRKVKYQWAGGIMIDYSEGMKENERYKVIGVIRKGGQVCGMNNEQCMLDEKGATLPYPTRIEVEKFYLIKQ